MTNAHAPAGWYPDPAGSGQQRYYDGTTWTANYAPPATPVAPAKKGHGCLYAILGAIAAVVLLVVVLLIALVGTAHKVVNDVTKANKQAMNEVKISACAADSLGDVEIDGTAHNTSSGRSDYLIEVVVNAKSGTQLDSTATAAQNVEPGQTAQWKALTSAKFAAGISCKVATATRHASLTP